MGILIFFISFISFLNPFSPSTPNESFFFPFFLEANCCLLLLQSLSVEIERIKKENDNMQIELRFGVLIYCLVHMVQCITHLMKFVLTYNGFVLGDN